MASQTPVENDPQAVARAESFWKNFGVATKWGVIFIVLIVVFLGVAFV